jgi:hypothetical protein
MCKRTDSLWFACINLFSIEFKKCKALMLNLSDVAYVRNLTLECIAEDGVMLPFRRKT